MDTSVPQVLPQTLLRVPFDQKWDILKPLIAHLYINQDWKLSDVSKAMREQHNFDATYVSLVDVLNTAPQLPGFHC